MKVNSRERSTAEDLDGGASEFANPLLIGDTHGSFVSNLDCFEKKGLETNTNSGNWTNATRGRKALWSIDQDNALEI